MSIEKMKYYEDEDKELVKKINEIVDWINSHQPEVKEEK